MEAIERLHFLAPSTGEREGGEKTQPFNRFPSHRVIVKSEFQGHKMLLMLILLMIGKRRWRKKITSGSGLTRYIFSLMYGTVHACDTRDINEHTQNLCPIHSKEAMTPMTHPKLSDLLQVFDRGQSEVSCLFRHPSNQVFHLEARVKQAPLQVFDRGHIKFLVGLQCSTPGTVRFSLELA